MKRDVYAGGHHCHYHHHHHQSGGMVERLIRSPFPLGRQAWDFAAMGIAGHARGPNHIAIGKIISPIEPYSKKKVGVLLPSAISLAHT